MNNSTGSLLFFFFVCLFFQKGGGSQINEQTTQSWVYVKVSPYELRTASLQEPVQSLWETGGRTADGRDVDPS